jgi:hypothetical protein
MGAVLGAVSLRCAAAASCPVTLVKLPGEGPPDLPPAGDWSASPVGPPSA